MMATPSKKAEDIELAGLESEAGSAAVEETETAEGSRKRRRRLPLGTQRLKLSLSPRVKQYFKDRGEVPRWINNDPGRLESATEEDSYRFVDQSELSDGMFIGESSGLAERAGLGSKVSRVVGTRGSGDPVVAYLMAKPVEDYEEDQRAKAASINAKEAAMRQGRTEKVENMYVPSTGIKILPAVGTKPGTNT